ncbi:MAG: methyltransferase RsmF C-terminal domain-like protein [Candidatus Woesearchaeota archaeon]
MKATVIILNSKQRKEIRNMIAKQHGVESLPGKVFFCLNKKERVYIANRELFDLDHDTLRVNAFGLYFGTFMKDGFRLSIEGAQMLISQCTKNVLPVTLSQRDQWLNGSDVELLLGSEDGELQTDELDAAVPEDGNYVILTYDDDVLGVGKKKNGRIMNYLPKSRRLSNIFSEYD